MLPIISCSCCAYVGKDNQSFGFGGTGKKSFSSQFDDYGEVSQRTIGGIVNIMYHLLQSKHVKVKCIETTVL